MFVRDPQMYTKFSLFEVFLFEPRKCLEKIPLYGLFCFDRFCIFFCILSFTVFCVVFFAPQGLIAVVYVPKYCVCFFHGWTWEFFICTNPLMRITMSFGVKKVFKDQERVWYDEIKKREKPNLGDAPMVHPSIFQGYSRASPSSSTKYQVISIETIF